MELFRKGFRRFSWDSGSAREPFFLGQRLSQRLRLAPLRSTLCNRPRLCMERVLRVLRLKHVPIFQQLCIEEALFYKTTSNW